METHDRKLAEQASPEVSTELRRALEFNQSVMANMGRWRGRISASAFLRAEKIAEISNAIVDTIAPRLL